MRYQKHTKTRLHSNSDGIAAIEFTLLFPILVVMLFAIIDISRFILINLKVDRAAHVITDTVTQYTPASNLQEISEISAARLDTDVLPLFGRIMDSYQNLNRQAVSITAAIKRDGGIKLLWQRSALGSEMVDISSVTTGKRPVNSPESIIRCTTLVLADDEIRESLDTMPVDQMFIIVETFYKYQPIVGQIFNTEILTPRTIFKYRIMAPRNDNLMSLPQNPPITEGDCT